MTSSRCIPMEGYFDNNATVCVKCPIECSLCSSLTVCSACSSRYVLNTSAATCDSCPYDCFTCNSLGNCLTCNSVSDHRQLDNSTFRCIPMPGYYENNETVSGQCSQGCINCTTSSNCFSCSTRFYLGPNSSCVPCRFDCYTCGSSGACLSCNSTTDFR